MTRPLVVAAHGTTSAAGRRVIEGCASRAGARLGVPVSVGYVDVCEPHLTEVLTPGAVVVPLFLATGYHVRYDVPAAAAQIPATTVTPALGAVAEVVEALAARLTEALALTGQPRQRLDRPITGHLDAVVLASAGSTLDAARAEVDHLGHLLAQRIELPVRVAYLSGPGRTLPQACADLRAGGQHRLAVVSHLLAPGVFLDRAHRLAAESGALLATGAVGSHEAISALVAARYLAHATPTVAAFLDQRRKGTSRSSSPRSLNSLRSGISSSIQPS